jgi:hypothetical protein
MPPAFVHPAGVNFVDEDARPTDVDAAIYYGGGDSYTRTRTYSQVSFDMPLTLAWMMLIQSVS